MQEKYRNTEVNYSKQQKNTGGTSHTVQKICVKQHIRQENHILKARAGLEGFKRVREGFEYIHNTSTSITEIFIHTGEKTIEVQTREKKTTEGTPHTVQKFCTEHHTRQENILEKKTIEVQNHTGVISKNNLVNTGIRYFKQVPGQGTCTRYIKTYRASPLLGKVLDKNRYWGRHLS